MTFEALAMITNLWRDGPRDFRGEFWSMGEPHMKFDGLGYHHRPFQLPHPPIAIARLTPGSANHKLAGEKGYIPVSLSISPDSTVTAQHWGAVVEGAARTGRVDAKVEGLLASAVA
jgi:alkanesulfonate monooxygenase SsuD/methylene tetrahydromethanopterin reductase-like flavin-dependent oxidoreductase (luciferase family)